jgi:hypothetical protein
MSEIVLSATDIFDKVLKHDKKRSDNRYEDFNGNEFVITPLRSGDIAEQGHVAPCFPRIMEKC